MIFMDKEDPENMTNEENSENSEISKPQMNPWGSDLIGEEDYIRLCQDFGIQPIEEMEIPSSMFAVNRYLRRKIVLEDEILIQ